VNNTAHMHVKTKNTGIYETLQLYDPASNTSDKRWFNNRLVESMELMYEDDFFSPIRMSIGLSLVTDF